MASNSNVPLDEALFESRIMPKIIEQLRELIEDSVQRTVDQGLNNLGVNTMSGKNLESPKV